jgi:hypothetical protein
MQYEVFFFVIPILFLIKQPLTLGLVVGWLYIPGSETDPLFQLEYLKGK